MPKFRHDAGCTINQRRPKLERVGLRANRVLSRDQLMDACYGTNSPAFDRSIDVCVGRLRKKLLDDPRNPAIRTVRNGGYIFAARVTRH